MVEATQDSNDRDVLEFQSVLQESGNAFKSGLLCHELEALIGDPHFGLCLWESDGSEPVNQEDIVIKEEAD
jgi:hypothetical protein